jgi:hypothetical protein
MAELRAGDRAIMRTVNDWPVEIKVLSIYSARPDYDNGASIRRAQIDDNGNIRSIALELLEPIKPGSVDRSPKPKIGDVLSALPRYSFFIPAPKGEIERWVFVPGAPDAGGTIRIPPYRGPISGAPLAIDRPLPIDRPSPDEVIDRPSLEDPIAVVFEHLQKHGALMEAELIEALGSPRKARRFALRLEEYSAQYQVLVKVETSATGKRYVFCGLSMAPNQESELGATVETLSPVAPRNLPIEPLAIVPALAPNLESELGAIDVSRPAPGKWIAAALVVPGCQGSIEYKEIKGRFYYYWRKSTAGFSGRRRESIYLGAKWEMAIAKLARLQNTTELSKASAPGAALPLSESVP